MPYLEKFVLVHVRAETKHSAGVVTEGDDAHTGAITADVKDIDDVTYKSQHVLFEIMHPDAA